MTRVAHRSNFTPHWEKCHFKRNRFIAFVYAGTKDRPVEKWTEVLVWQLLARPQPPRSTGDEPPLLLQPLPAVLWLEAAWFHDRNQDRGGHADASAEHAAVLSRYRLPQVVMFEAFRAATPGLPSQPLAPGQPMPPAAAEALKWLTNVYFADNMHPSVK